jgi:hypothetical protein
MYFTSLELRRMPPLKRDDDDQKRVPQALALEAVEAACINLQDTFRSMCALLRATRLSRVALPTADGGSDVPQRSPNRVLWSPRPCNICAHDADLSPNHL